LEHVFFGIWRAAPDDDGEKYVDEWAPIAAEEPSVEACTISLPDPDQGRFPGPPCAALITMGLTRAHDLDDIPARDLLYKDARDVMVWRVEPHPVIETRDVTEMKMVSFVRRREELTHEQFVRHWSEVHAPLARAHHVGLAAYTQNVVRRAYSPGGANIDGIAELCFRTRADFEERFYDSEEGKRAIRADVAEFIGPSGVSATLMREVVVRG
jgi:uncharacterized protein (TIGR02118 family)